MRVALIVERFSPLGGGVERATWEVAHRLAARGESVSVLCRDHAPPAHHEAPETLRVACLPVHDGWQAWRVTAFARRVEARLAREDFDLVHSFTRTPHQDIYRAGAGRHTTWMRQTYGPIGRKLRALTPRHRLALRGDRRIFRDRRQWIQCPARMIRDDLVEGAGVGADRVVVIPNGVDTERFRPSRAEPVRQLREDLSTPGETVWLLAGSGARRKGLTTAIEALAHTRVGRPVLWIAGRDAPAPHLAHARRLGVGERVRFLGERADLEHVYPAADGFLLPTRYDPFANVCLEAAACGLPVISTRQNGAMEVIADGGVALERPDDATSLARALDRLAEPGARADKAASARKRALAANWDEHVRQLQSFYARVAAERAPRGAAT